jgi:hypothetical protein
LTITVVLDLLNQHEQAEWPNRCPEELLVPVWSSSLRLRGLLCLFVVTEDTRQRHNRLFFKEDHQVLSLSNVRGKCLSRSVFVCAYKVLEKNFSISLFVKKAPGIILLMLYDSMFSLHYTYFDNINLISCPCTYSIF